MKVNILERILTGLFGPTCEAVILRYMADGCLDEYRNERPVDTYKAEMTNCRRLLAYWAKIRVRKISLPLCDLYRDARKKQMQRGKGGGRTVELEQNTFRNALKNAIRVGLLKAMPKVAWPSYCAETEVVHCKDAMPANINDLHDDVEELMKKRRSRPIGFCSLFLALTGLRVHEALLLRWDANPGQPGYISEDGLLSVQRGKKQQDVNPVVEIHDDLRDLLLAMRQWHDEEYPDSPWFFPSPADPEKTIDKGSVTRALARLAKIKRKRRS